MTYGAYASGGYAPTRRGARRFTQPILCGTALVLGTGVGLCMLYGAAPEPAAGPKPPLAISTHPAASTSPPASARPRVFMHYTGLLDPTPAMGTAAFTKGPQLAAQDEPAEPTSHLVEIQSADGADVEAPLPPARVAETEIPLPPQRDAAMTAPLPDVPLPPERLAEVDLPVIPAPPAVSALEEVPLPMPRPRALAPAPARRLALVAPRPAPAPSFFDRMFGRQPPPGPALAYADPEERGIGRPGAAAAYGGQTAIYDITAHTVYMPDGTRLEAHSGLGAAFDNPASVTEHMRGATPPNVYALTPREAVFHGVRALRLTPLAGTTFGREGLLAHTYMLRGHSGESNGCVVFRNYSAFLAAYERGEITKLAVVARL